MPQARVLTAKVPIFYNIFFLILKFDLKMDNVSSSSITFWFRGKATSPLQLVMKFYKSLGNILEYKACLYK